MRKSILFIFILIILSLTACRGSDKTKSNSTTEGTSANHKEESLTAVMIKRNTETNNIFFLDYVTGKELELGYHGGVSVKDKYGENVSLNDLPIGSIVDISFYSDTDRLISICANSNVQTIKGVNKFVADIVNNKASYKGSSSRLSEYALAFEDGNVKSILEVSTEDQVTLYLINNVIVSCVIDVGHGYVRLKNQDTYIGGMVEIGYDVIVPVTSDMLLAVREGTYTLRINKGGYSGTKEVTVTKGEEIDVDLWDIAIPKGTVSFLVTPAEAEIYVDNNLLESHAFTGLYGSYGLKIKAEGYKSFNGSFKISEPVKTFTFELVENKENTTETTTEELTEDIQTTQNSVTDTQTSTENITTTEDNNLTTESYQGATNNTITVKSPIGVGVYVDGNYVGYAPVTFQKVVGTHSIVLYQAGSLIKTYTIQAVDDGKDDEYSFDALTTLSDLINVDY